MKKLILPVLFLTAAILACTITIPTPTQQVTQPPANPPEPSITPTETVPAEPSGPANNVTCNELSFYLDPTLGSSYSCETLPAITDGPVFYPQHTLVTIQGYPLADKRLDPQIAVFSVPAYAALLPDFVNPAVTTLQTLSAGGHAPVFSGSFSAGLPLLPTLNAAQVFFAHYLVTPFQGGSGIRFLTEYAQFYAPVNNYDMFYAFQGLTADGQWWVSVMLPVNHAMLQADGNNPPAGYTWDQLSAQYDTYITDMIDQLNAQADNTFTPGLASLDALVASITVTP